LLERTRPDDGVRPGVGITLEIEDVVEAGVQVQGFGRIESHPDRVLARWVADERRRHREPDERPFVGAGVLVGDPGDDQRRVLGEGCQGVVVTPRLGGRRFGGARGSPLALITQNNAVSDAWEHDPYGVADLTEQSVTQTYTPFMYTGGLNDRVTGWTLNGARYYDAGEGRWTQMDTLDAPLDPSNANRYAYAANNPVSYTDPTGRATGADFVGAVAVVCLRL
jgi:RHS repeat-associated protein